MKGKRLTTLALCLLLTAGCSAGSNSTAGSSNAMSAPAAMEADAFAGYGVEFNTEEYDYIEENGFRSTALSPLSTFAADVDTASYANLRWRLLANREVPADAVRVEEMLNYFHYDYPEPEGDEPFSVTAEVFPCPWNEDTQVLRIGLQAVQLDWEELPPSNLVFLIDVSGSMDASNKLPLVKQAFLMLTEHLRPEDRVSIVTYASTDTVVLEGASGEEGAEIQTAIERLTAGGSTAGAQGIQTAYALAEQYFIEGGNNRIILATDGDLNVGLSSEGELTRLVEEKKKSGVFLSVMGFGSGNLKDNKLEALADHGDGNCSYIDSVLEARRVLVEEMGGTLFTVAKDVKIQVEFNPSQIKGYRLIGYEDRLMAAEDFNDDQKDGGEIGAGHRVTVLYELVDIDSPMEIPGADLKYQSAQPSDSEEYLTVSIRYKEPDGTESKLLTCPVGPESVRQEPSEDGAFACAVAQFGMLLRESEYTGSATYAGIVEQLSALPSVAEDDYKAELLYLVRQQARRTATE